MKNIKLDDKIWIKSASGKYDATQVHRILGEKLIAQKKAVACDKPCDKPKKQAKK